jgi:hypothetical protein
VSALDPDTLERYLPDEPLTSLRRIETAYGAMAEAAQASSSGEVGEFDLFHTPGDLSGFTTDSDDDRYLVTVNVDLTGDEPALDDEPVTVERLRPGMVGKLGFSRYPWGRAIDHSVTRRGAKGGSSRSTVATYCAECLGRWTDADDREPAVGEVADTHPDGWVIRDLQAIGRHDDLEQRFEEALERVFPAADSPRVVATVAIQLEPSSLERPPTGEQRPYYPGELHVMNAAMRARNNEKLAKKNTDAPSRGEGACMVTGESGEVFGTAEDPLAFFTVQHAEKFAGLSRGNAWRSHPVSDEAALLLQSGASLIEDCSRTRDGLRVYVIPYFVDMTPERADVLYRAVRNFADDSASMATFYRGVSEYGPEAADSLRFYVIGVRNDSGDINVLHELPDATIYPVQRVGKAHADVLVSSTFKPRAGFDRPPENWRGLAETTGADDVVRLITSGLYAGDTLGPVDSDAPTSDDPREWFTRSLIAGDVVPAGRLLEEYVDRIAHEQDPSEGQFPARHVKTQYAQLEALARAGRLTAPDSPELTEQPMTGTHDDATSTRNRVRATDGGAEQAGPLAEEITTDGEVSQLAARRYRLSRFIEQRSALSDNPERRGAFLTGVLVGQLSDHQRTNREMNRTLREQHPAERMTAERIERLIPTLTDRSGTYASEVGWAGTQLFPETQRRLMETTSRTPPGDWSVSAADLRFFYALGVTYGAEADWQARQLVEQVSDHE